MFQVIAFLLFLSSALAADPPPYESLDQSLTTFRGTGFEIEIALTKKDSNGGTRYFGLMKDGRDLLFEGEVTQITGDWDPVHFFRDRTRAYLLRVDGIVVPIPGPPLSDRPFRVFRPDPKWLPARDARLGWRAIEIERQNGSIETIWGGLGGKVYMTGIYPPDSITTKVPELTEIPRVYTTLSDFRSRFEAQPAAANDARTAYVIWGVTPDSGQELHFDFLELRPDPLGLQAFVQSRTIGREGVRQAAGMLGHIPHYFLSNVYHAFKNQPDRPAFNEKLMEKVMVEDATLGIDRLIYVWTQDQMNRIVGGVRLYQGFENDRFLSKKNLLPVERSHSHLGVRDRFPGIPLYEMNRLTVRKDFESDVSTKRLFSVMMQYLEERDLPVGQIIFHTDEWGSNFFPRFTGATLLFGPEATLDGTYVLSVSTETLKARMIPESPFGRPVRGLRLPKKWCSWALSP